MAFEVGRCLLRDIFDQRKLDRTKVCDDLRITPTHLSDYVNRRRVMSLKTAKEFAHYLGVAIDDLYEFIETANPPRSKPQGERN